MNGVALVVVTSFGETAAQVAANVADAINQDPTLQGQFVSAEATGGKVETNGDVSDVVIGDSGLAHRTIPTLSEWGLIVMGLLLLAAIAVALRRARPARSSM